MNVEPTEHTNHNPNDSTSNPKSAAGEGKADGHAASEFAHRASVFAKSLPNRIDHQLRRNPYATLAAVAIVATAVGMVMSSRVLRGVLTATMTAVALDVGRGLVRQIRFQVESP